MAIIPDTEDEFLGPARDRLYSSGRGEYSVYTMLYYIECYKEVKAGWKTKAEVVELIAEAWEYATLLAYDYEEFAGHREAVIRTA